MSFQQNLLIKHQGFKVSFKNATIVHNINFAYFKNQYNLNNFMNLYSLYYFDKHLERLKIAREEQQRI